MVSILSGVDLHTLKVQPLISTVPIKKLRLHVHVATILQTKYIFGQFYTMFIPFAEKVDKNAGQSFIMSRRMHALLCV